MIAILLAIRIFFLFLEMNSSTGSITVILPLGRRSFTTLERDRRPTIFLPIWTGSRNTV